MIQLIYRGCKHFQLRNHRTLSWTWRQWQAFSSEEVEQIGLSMSKLTPIERSDSPLIEKYSTKGFTISGNKVYGSVALLPKAYFHWKVTRASDITPDSFTLFHIIKPKLELVILGTGARVIPVHPDIKQYLKSKGIALEIQDTHNACAAFHYLMDEGRLAGAALIPPEYL